MLPFPMAAPHPTNRHRFPYIAPTGFMDNITTFIRRSGARGVEAQTL
ncbi:MAG: hypothetical protein F6J93_14235 [Oscillatoria sp. SIO1A7]|nr:hypothetical protein [Oscillatoria sp. SIO1A7]